MLLCRKYTTLNGEKKWYQCEGKGRDFLIVTIIFKSIFVYIFLAKLDWYHSLQMGKNRNSNAIVKEAIFYYLHVI